jgi:NAD(P)-dependent dehydrogenase (short-subunit alcohol dehydrogenase family)
MSQSLSGKTVLITGAARGIGEHTARQAAARGARLALLGLEPARLHALAAELSGSATGGEHVWFECDVTDQASLDRAVSASVLALGGIDAVVANAGVANLGTVALGPVDALVRTIEVNLIGAVRTVGATIDHVISRRGYYLLVSSAAAFTVLPGMAAYCASKAGVEQFGNALRLEVAHRGVMVGTAHMSWVDTDMVRDVNHDLGSFGQTRSRLRGPLGKVTPVQVCARAFVDGIARRRRRVYVPRGIALVQAMRALVISPLSEAGLRRIARTSVPQMEAEVAALGRRFGEHSVALPAAAPVAESVAAASAAPVAEPVGTASAAPVPESVAQEVGEVPV